MAKKEHKPQPSAASGDAGPLGVVDAAERLGGVSSNTPPSNPKTDSTESGDNDALLVTTGGEDWLELSLYAEHKRFEALSKRLDLAKAAATEGRSPADELTFAGQRFICRASVGRAGAGSKRIAYRWVLDSEAGYKLLLMNRVVPHTTLPNIILVVSSLPLMRHGATLCGSMAIAALKAMGITVIANKLSRVDPCVDLANANVEPFFDAYSSGHYITRARNSREYLEDSLYAGFRVMRKPTGFTIGLGDVRCRIYDKALESRYHPEKLMLLANRRWTCKAIEATRVEFQLRRQKLMALGIDTIENWFEKRGAVTEYLTHDWLRFFDGPFDRKHPEKDKLLPEWEIVQRSFAEWCGSSREDVLAPLPKGPINVDHLLKQWVGLTLSILARQDRPITNHEAFLHESMYLLAEQVENRDIAEEFRRCVLEQRAGR